MTQAPRDFRELVNWACWEVVQGFGQGRALHSILHDVLAYAIQWTDERRKAEGGAA